MAEAGADPGSGAPDGGSPEGGQGKPPNDDVVPKSQFLAAIRSANEKFDSLKAEMEAKLAEATKRPVEAPKRYSRAELNAAAAAGTITQEAADSEWERQIREDARLDARQEAQSTVSEAHRKERVTSEIARYTALVPELLQEGSTDRSKVRAEFQYLTGLGSPRTLETELAAIRAAFGPVETLEQARRGKPSFESHQEHGAGGGEHPRKQGNGKLIDTLSARERKHYERQIEQGVINDWAAVEDELKYAKAHVRKRMGAKV